MAVIASRWTHRDTLRLALGASLLVLLATALSGAWGAPGQILAVAVWAAGITASWRRGRGTGWFLAVLPAAGLLYSAFWLTVPHAPWLVDSAAVALAAAPLAAWPVAWFISQLGARPAQAALAAGSLVLSAWLVIVGGIAWQALFNRPLPKMIYEAGGPVRDIECGYLIAPYSHAISRYPDNPRGYFHQLARRGVALDGWWVEYEFNSQGLRERELASPKPLGTYRIIILGDSLVFGQGVHAGDTAGRQLEAILNQRAKANNDPRQYEVVNAGISGYSTREERAMFERIAPVYEPDLVLVGMYVNDHWPIEIDLVTDDALPEEPPHRESYGLCAEELARLNELCEARGARLAVFLFRYELSTAAWDWLRATVDEALSPRGVPWIDLGDELLRRADGADLRVHFVDGHPNELAHRLAAQLLAEFLRQRFLEPSRPKTK